MTPRMSLRAPLMTLTLFSLLTACVPDTPEWGPPDISVVDPPISSETVVALTAGSHHVCALSDIGNVTCWGNNDAGQLGYAHTEPVGDNEPAGAYGNVFVGLKVNSITAGDRHTCALLASGNVRCWGDGDDLQLGRGDAEWVGDDETPVTGGDANLGDMTFREVAAGYRHTCALNHAGAIMCWGTSEYGALGNGDVTTIDTDTPPPVLSMGGAAVSLVTGSKHSCAILDDASVRCWGRAVGLGTGDDERIDDDELTGTMSTVPIAEPVAQLAAGALHTCALSSVGNIRCWGDASQGVLGYGDTVSVMDASQSGLVHLGARAVQIAAGYDHTCALKVDGAVRCWGNGASGSLGYGSTDSIGDDETPIIMPDVELAEPATSVVAGHGFTCALLESGAVSCWGSGADGRLGNGNEQNIGDDEEPASIEPISPFG